MHRDGQLIQNANKIILVLFFRFSSIFLIRNLEQSIAKTSLVPTNRATSENVTDSGYWKMIQMIQVWSTVWVINKSGCI